MKTGSHLIALTYLIASFSIAHAQENSWRGLTPLKSSRIDVEKVLGKPVDTKFRIEYHYEPENENVTVQYSTRKCDQGWNVPPGTVLSMGVSSKAMVGKSFKELGLDENKLFVSIDDALYATWTDPVRGRDYYFGNVDQQFISTSYIPSRTDNKLRCNGWPPYRPEGLHWTMEKYGLYNPKASTDSLYEVIAWIQSRSVELKGMRQTHSGYAVVYFDNRLSLHQYRSRLALIKKWAFGRLEIPASDLIFIEGGMRETSEIEFYILPKKWASPSPDPTMASPQFRRKKVGIKGQAK